jgi:hypothetical protein
MRRTKPGRPTLIALDFHNKTARRYWPKPGDQRPATFITQEGTLQKPEGEPWQMGSLDGLALLDAFRAGTLPAQVEAIEKECA